jgi:uncharacterized protein YjbI with pentapeptide repeats
VEDGIDKSICYGSAARFRETSRMHRPVFEKARSTLLLFSLSAALFATILLLPKASEAACTDPPGAGVDWRSCNFDNYPLAGVNLTGANLNDASFNWADLTGANLDGARGRARFARAKMAGATFRDAQLRGADFSQAKLNDADFTGADLADVRFQSAILRGANLTGARVRNADFFRADLSGAIWTDGKHICAEGSISFCR